jgi:dynein heavy chain 1
LDNAETASSSSNNNNGISNPCLFVWIPVKTTTTGGYAQAFVSMDKLDPDNLGAVVFINTAVLSMQKQQLQNETSSGQQQRPIQHCSQVSCIVLSPPDFERGNESAAETLESKKIDKNNKAENSDEKLDYTLQTLKYLQLYTRHCFVPVIQAIEAKEEKEIGQEVTSASAGGVGDFPSSTRESNKRSLILESLQDKLRQLDQALEQVQRTSNGIANLHLYTHPILARAIRNVTDVSKIQLEEVLGPDLLQNDKFLNEVQSIVQTQWIPSIQKITNLPRETQFPPMGPGSDLEEARFWKSLQEALTSCRTELAKTEVVFTIQILKSAKRFLATIALENNTGLDEAEAITLDINAYLQQIPFESLVSAREVARIEDATKNILSHLPKARQSRYYDLDRLIMLVEGVTCTMSKQLCDVLKSKYKGNGIILHLKYDAYLALQDSILQLWDTWDHEFIKFKDWFVDHARKIKWTSKVNKYLTSTKIIDSLTMHHASLKERLAEISYFRSQHERLLTVITEVLEGDDPNAVRDVEEAPFTVFATVDVFNLTSQGSAAFYGALEAYDRRMDVMEERLARLLRAKLEAAEDAEELFRVFARFNPLLFRNRVRAAVKDFQIQLIQTVTCAINNLLSKFSEHYETSPSFNMASARGIPPVSGKIIWAKQIERQVTTWMSRMSNVLGDDWGQQLDGRTLRRSCDELLAKLDARSFLRSWILQWEKELISGTSSRLETFPIIITTSSQKKDKYEARVNLDNNLELLFHEVRTLLWLGFEKDIPRTLRSLSDEAFSRFPYAIALRSSLRSYSATRKSITPEMEPLLESELFSIRDIVSEAFDVGNVGRKGRIKWDSPSLGAWVAKLSQLVSNFETRVDILTQESYNIDGALNKLKSSRYTITDMDRVVGEIQKSVDTLSLAGFSHLGIWIDSAIDMRIQTVLVARLEAAIQLWIDSLESGSYPADIISVDIVLRNQKISATPSPYAVRSTLLSHLHDFIGIVLNLPRPSGSKFEVFEGADIHATTQSNTCNFHFLIQRVNPELLCKAYAEAEVHINNLSNFVATWLSYQSLWDTRMSDVMAALGEHDLHVWYSTLIDIRAARAALDANSTKVNFGPILVRYDKVRSVAL